MRRILLLGLLLVVACQPTTTPMPPTATPGPGTGDPIRGDTGTVYRLMADGTIRHVQDWATFLAWGYSPGDVQQLPPADIAGHALAAPLTRFVTSPTDQALYALFNGRRYALTDPLPALADLAHRVVLLPDDVLASFPPGNVPYPAPAVFANEPPAITASAWWQGDLWIADDTGTIRRFSPGTGRFTAEDPLTEGYVTALAHGQEALYAGTNTGHVFALPSNGNDQPVPLVDSPGWISALVSSAEHGLIFADQGHYDFVAGRYVAGQGVRGTEGQPLLPANEAHQRITALAQDGETLWAATDYAGLLHCRLVEQTCASRNTFNSTIPDNTIRDVDVATDGTLWIAFPGGVARVTDAGEGSYQSIALAQGISPSGVRTLSLAPDGSVWAAGEFFVANARPDGTKSEVTAFDHPLFLDQFDTVAVDTSGQPWFAGRRHLITFDGDQWTAYTYDGTSEHFTPGDLPLQAVLAFPDPLDDYQSWLRTWPRPQDDNGLCMHYVQSPSGDEFESRQQIARLQRLGVRWTLVNYVGRAQLLQLASLFARTNITVVWRPYASPAFEYPNWADDVRFLRSIGLPPYMQVYNEPNLAQEWNENPPGEAQSIYLRNVIQAVPAVYDAGGYVGLQHIDLEWLRATLNALEENGLQRTFDRMFFVPHPYGFNHPPAYDADQHAVLGFRNFAALLQEEIGFVPVMVAGEGGWRPGEAQDANYPAVSEELHRDYHQAVFGWFQTGILSNGEPLPDYLFAFCPWLLSDLFDPAAWFDSRAGDRTLTIQTIESTPLFTRRFGP